MARKEGPRLNPKSAKNLVGVAKVVAPALIPVLAPVLARGASVLSDRYDRYRARQLGVDVADLGKFTGRGARLHARIVGFGEALDQLRAKEGAYVEQTEARLAKLAAAVKAAERMPTARRKAVHRAVSTDLDVLEADLLRRLGLTS